MKRLRARRYGTKVSIALTALIFAGLWVGIQNFDRWQDSWRAKVGHPAPVTVRLPAQYFRVTMLRNEFHYLSTSSSQCPRMVPRGERLRPFRECSRLAAAFDSYRRPPTLLNLVGSYAFYLIIAVLLGTAMRLIPNGRCRSLRGQLSIFTLLTVAAAAWKSMLLFTAFPAFLLPVVLLPLLGTFFFVRRLGLTLAFVASLLAASLVNFDIEVMLVHLVGGLASVIFLTDRRRARGLLKAAALTALVSLGAAAITTLVFSGTLSIHDELAHHFDPQHSLWLSAIFGSLGSGILSVILYPVVGLMTGAVSRSRLHDLQDLDQTLLRLLRERAPSTWEHSRAIANLAEAAAHAIGANALLVRVGAYYHDVGKTIHPELFIENQGGGPNPHDAMTPAESRGHIFHHVIEGTKLLRAEGVPEDVIEFCYSHHGTSVLEYFWYKNMAAGNPNGLSEGDFTYPGHKPSSRETGIMMIVDAIEAAARTVEAPEKSKFQNLVQRVMFTKLGQGQLDDTGLSVADLRIIASTLTDTLASMYHARIKYPWQQDDTTGVQDVTPSSGQIGAQKLTTSTSLPVTAPAPTPSLGVPVATALAASATPVPGPQGLAADTANSAVAPTDKQEAIPATPPSSGVVPAQRSPFPPAPVDEVEPTVGGTPVPIQNAVPTEQPSPVVPPEEVAQNATVTTSTAIKVDREENPLRNTLMGTGGNNDITSAKNTLFDEAAEEEPPRAKPPK